MSRAGSTMMRKRKPSSRTTWSGTTGQTYLRANCASAGAVLAGRPKNGAAAPSVVGDLTGDAPEIVPHRAHRGLDLGGAHLGKGMGEIAARDAAHGDVRADRAGDGGGDRRRALDRQHLERTPQDGESGPLQG